MVTERVASARPSALTITWCAPGASAISSGVTPDAAPSIVTCAPAGVEDSTSCPTVLRPDPASADIRASLVVRRVPSVHFSHERFSATGSLPRSNQYAVIVTSRMPPALSATSTRANTTVEVLACASISLRAQPVSSITKQSISLLVLSGGSGEATS